MNRPKRNLCAKQTVTAHIITAGDPACVVQGWNYCKTPRMSCPRGKMKTGEGYEMCREICQQENHAEVDAILNARTFGIDIVGGIMVIHGHTYCCDDCISTMRDAGLAGYIVDGEYTDFYEIEEG